MRKFDVPPRPVDLDPRIILLLDDANVERQLSRNLYDREPPINMLDMLLCLYLWVVLLSYRVELLTRRARTDKRSPLIVNLGKN
jgi:hypothetical protein